MDRKDVPLIEAVKTAEKDVVLDQNGFFVIELREKKIYVEYYANVYRNDRIVSGNLKMVFMGTKADALSDTIAQHVPLLLPEHYMYLGRELCAAESALRNNLIYEQGGC